MKLSVIENLSMMKNGTGRGTSRFTLHQVLLCALLAIALLTPFLQIDSLDRFPTSTDDIEVHITCCLSILGMLLVFARILKAVPAMLRAWLTGGLEAHPSLMVAPAGIMEPAAACLYRFVPLRI